MSHRSKAEPAAPTRQSLTESRKLPRPPQSMPGAPGSQRSRGLTSSCGCDSVFDTNHYTEDGVAALPQVEPNANCYQNDVTNQYNSVEPVFTYYCEIPGGEKSKLQQSSSNSEVIGRGTARACVSARHNVAGAYDNHGIGGPMSRQAAPNTKGQGSYCTTQTRFSTRTCYIGNHICVEIQFCKHHFGGQ